MATERAKGETSQCARSPAPPEPQWQSRCPQRGWRWLSLPGPLAGSEHLLAARGSSFWNSAVPHRADVSLGREVTSTARACRRPEDSILGRPVGGIKLGPVLAAGAAAGPRLWSKTAQGLCTLCLPGPQSLICTTGTTSPTLAAVLGWDRDPRAQPRHLLGSFCSSSAASFHTECLLKQHFNSSATLRDGELLARGCLRRVMEALPLPSDSGLPSLGPRAAGNAQETMSLIHSTGSSCHLRPAQHQGQPNCSRCAEERPVPTLALLRTPCGRGQFPPRSRSAESFWPLRRGTVEVGRDLGGGPPSPEQGRLWVLYRCTGAAAWGGGRARGACPMEVPSPGDWTQTCT